MKKLLLPLGILCAALGFSASIAAANSTPKLLLANGEPAAQTQSSTESDATSDSSSTDQEATGDSSSTDQEATDDPSSTSQDSDSNDSDSD